MKFNPTSKEEYEKLFKGLTDLMWNAATPEEKVLYAALRSSATNLYNDAQLGFQAAEHHREVARSNPVTGHPGIRARDEDALTWKDRNYDQTLQDYIAVSDIDFFKDINKKQGHAGANITLRKTMNLLRETMQGAMRRPHDFLRPSPINPEVQAEENGRVYHLHGDEMQLLFRAPNDQTAISIVERHRRNIEQLSEEQIGCRITLSYGLTPWYNDELISAAVERADKIGSYASKAAGRNRVTFIPQGGLELRTLPSTHQ